RSSGRCSRRGPTCTRCDGRTRGPWAGLVLVPGGPGDRGAALVCAFLGRGGYRVADGALWSSSLSPCRLYPLPCSRVVSGSRFGVMLCGWSRGFGPVGRSGACGCAGAASLVGWLAPAPGNGCSVTRVVVWVDAGAGGVGGDAVGSRCGAVGSIQAARRV